MATKLTRRMVAFVPLLMAAAAPDAQPEDALTRQLGGRSFDEFHQCNVTRLLSARCGRDNSGCVRDRVGERIWHSPGKFGRSGGREYAVSTCLAQQVHDTATAIATLVDRSVVSWDVPVRQFSPDTMLAETYATDNATCGITLTIAPGCPPIRRPLGPAWLWCQELVRRARFLPFDHSFRAEWAYSNYGIFLGQQSAAHAAG